MVLLTVNGTDRPRGLWAIGLVGLFYLLDGIVFGALAGSAASQQMRVAWRLAAWATSGVAFALHIGYERFRLRNPPLVTALRTSLAAAVGAFGLAAAANVHALLAALEPRHRLLIALLAWPVIVAAPAFVVAFAAASLLAPARPSEGP